MFGLRLICRSDFLVVIEAVSLAVSELAAEVVARSETFSAYIFSSSRSFGDLCFYEVCEHIRSGSSHISFVEPLSALALSSEAGLCD